MRRSYVEGGIVTGSLYGDPVIPRMHAEGPPYGRPTKQCFVVEPVGSHLHPRGQLKMPHTLAIVRRAQILRWDNMTACGPVAAQANLPQVKPRPPRRPKPMCLSRFKAIRPSLVQRGTARRASQNAVRFGRTSGFVHPADSHIVNEAIIC